MTNQQKSYAIKCSTEEQARECRENNYFYFFKIWLVEGYTIITYEEAISLGLLGEKKEDDLVPRGYSPGLYTYGKCSDCKCDIHFVEKRAWRCKECAIKERDKSKIEPQQNEVQEVDLSTDCKNDKHGIYDGKCFACGKVFEGYPENPIYEVQESPSEDNLVEKIMEEMSDNTSEYADTYHPAVELNDIKKILMNYLSYK